MQFEVGRIWGKAKSTSDFRPILQITWKYEMKCVIKERSRMDLPISNDPQNP